MIPCELESPLCLGTQIAMAMFILGFALAVVRLLRGPSTPDRVLALEIVTLLTVGVLAVYSVMTNQPALLSVALVPVLVSFLGTVAFARYLEKRGRR